MTSTKRSKASSPGINTRGIGALITRGSFMSVRIGLLRADFNPAKHGRKIDFAMDTVPFVQIDGGPIAEFSRESAVLRVVGYDKPQDGFAFDLTISTPDAEDGVLLVAKGRFGYDAEPMYQAITTALNQCVNGAHIVNAALAKILLVAWGFDFDEDDIREEVLDDLEGVHVEIAFDGAERLSLDERFAGGLFAEITPHNDEVPFMIDRLEQLIIDEDLDWEAFRRDSDRFVVALAPASLTPRLRRKRSASQ